LRAADRAAPELSAQVQRLEATFPWPEGRPWTYDQPFLYQVTARLSAAGASDTAPPTRFGHRTFEQRDGGFYLNGQPTHLRGHQIDLGWGNQFPRLEELKAAGLNAFEFSAPVSATWYRALPYRLGEYERFLSYADEHGLIAIPLLPDAQVLRERLFDPEVARLYRRRLDKHVRRFGNHASVGLWFMHFNLAGYRWYVAPSLNDGSHQPSDPLWRQKERYALQAERLYQEVDRRPLYHHACGNLGDSFTANIYIGPTSPLQEREEWPRRWAESRRKPLLAVEHGLMLIPYWFRYRDFPLDKVYASEPLFDEISAMYLGRSAYRQLTPELFELYDVGRAPRPTRMRTLIQRHPGYQQVKSYFASRSLRSWRTYGISATIFNAENWDFKDATGQPLPVMQAMARYFGDTDLYVAGAGDDWPSKDHAWFAGEPLRKQVVLLNDLSRDLPVKLTWSLAPGDGPAVQQGTCQAVARAGEVTMVPLQLTAPTVTARTDFTLTITPPEGGPFQPESFALSVWPKPERPAVEGGVLVHDVEGRATAMLAAAGIAATPLRQAANLQGVKLVVVGRRSLDDAFLAQARRLDLEAAVRDGANLLILEQTTGRPLGLELKEQSTRQAFIAAPGHPFLAGLTAADLVDLRGQSDLLEPYPAAPPETEKQFPARFFKWGNRGVLASYVYTKPHLAGFLPVLECGFDLADSPLLEGRFGRGRVTLCQVDVSARYGQDPVATALADNLLAALSQPGPAAHAVAVSEAASTFLAPYGLAPAASSEAAGLVISERWSPALEAQARAGATVLLLPGAKAPELGLSTTPQRVFIAHPEEHPLLAGLSGADLYFKEWTELPVIAPANGWQPLAAPAVLAVKPLDQGQVIACTVDPFLMGNRGQVKATRFWSLLLANLGAAREPTGWLAPTRPLYVPNPLEVIPPYMNW
ncbi:MAG: hypothetical protein HUU35_06715, partial [Armatimonadetes bacterium]|nr:hypothetical protein [Armatimonadota bacterium]